MIETDVSTTTDGHEGRQGTLHDHGCKLGALSVMVFAYTMFFVPLVLGFFFDTLHVDVAALIVGVLGASVEEGSRRAAKWAIGFMAWYLLVALIGSASLIFRFGELHFGTASATLWGSPWLLWVLAFVAAWAATNVVLLYRFLRDVNT